MPNGRTTYYVEDEYGKEWECEVEWYIEPEDLAVNYPATMDYCECVSDVPEAVARNAEQSCREDEDRYTYDCYDHKQYPLSFFSNAGRDE